jgi:hypothetical protein
MTGMSGMSGHVGAFSWDDYPNIKVRFDFRKLSNLITATAASFDGTQSLDIDNGSAQPTAYPITMCCWFKTSTAAFQCLMFVGDSGEPDEAQYLGCTGSQVQASSISNADGVHSATESTNDPDDGSYHFAGAVFTSPTRRDVWFDENTDLEGTSVTIGGTYDRISIGRLGDSTPSGEINGEIDMAYAWSRALTPANMAWLEANKPTYTTLSTSTDADNPGITGIIGAWSLSEDTGVRMDSSDNSMHLADNNGVTSDVGTVEEIAEIEDRAVTTNDITNAYLNASGASFGLTYPCSLECWVKTTDNARGIIGLLVDSSNYISIDVLSDKAYAEIEVGGSLINDVSVPEINDDKWHHCVAIFRATNLEVGVDGSLSGTPSNHAFALPALSAVYIGRYPAQADTAILDGTIDEVRVWDVELDATDITELYNGGAGVLCQDLISGAVVLTSGAKPVHAWPLSKNTNGGVGADIGTTGGVTLTEVNSPADASGIAAGQTLDGTIKQSTDLSGNNRHVTQSTFLKRPEAINITDDYAGQSDGSNDFMQTSSFTAITQPSTIFLLTTVRDQSGAQTLTDGIAAANEAGLKVTAADVFAVDAGTEAATTFDIDYGNRHLWIVVFNGASTKVYRDGGTPQTVNAGAESQTGISLFAAEDESQPSDQDLEFYLVNDGAMTDNELNEIGIELIGADWTDVA